MEGRDRELRNELQAEAREVVEDERVHQATRPRSRLSPPTAGEGRDGDELVVHHKGVWRYQKIRGRWRKTRIE